MRNCKQFTELHFAKMLTALPVVRYVDVAGSTDLSFDCVYWLCREMQNLMLVNFDPKNPRDEIDGWRLIFTYFRYIHFGHNITVCMPHYGNMWRVPDNSNSESGNDWEE